MSDTATGYWRIVEAIWEQINIYEGAATFLLTNESVGEPASLLFAAHFAQSEICNGGFKQFFGNSTGVLGPEAVRGFQLIGMSDTAATIATAMSEFGTIYPRERAERKQKLTSLDKDVFDLLNSRFFGLIRSESGGFEAAADAFALTLEHAPPNPSSPAQI